MKNWQLILAIIVGVVVFVGGAMFLFSNKQDPQIAEPPAAEQVVQTSAPSARPVPPTPPKPLPTPPQINDCAETSRKANNLSARDARHLQVGQKVVLVVNGQRREVMVAAGDHFWKMCRVALTDPVSARYHAAKKEIASLNEQVATLDREMATIQATLAAKTRDRTVATNRIATANQRVADAQAELNARHAAEVAERRRASAAANARRQQPAARTTS